MQISGDGPQIHQTLRQLQNDINSPYARNAHYNLDKLSPLIKRLRKGKRSKNKIQDILDCAINLGLPW